MMRRAEWMTAMALIGVLAIGAGTSRADFVSSWSTVANSYNNSSNVVFTAVGDNLTIQLTNLTAPTEDAKDLLTRLRFGFTSGTVAGTLNAGSGLERTVNGDGSYADGGVTSNTGWELNADVTGWNPGQGNWLSRVGAGNGIKHTLIGPPSGNDNDYGSANSSVAGNNGHNPFLAGTATFTLTFNGLGASGATISLVQFYYNTDAGLVVNGAPDAPAVPEPSSVVLAGMATVAGIVGFARSRRRSAV